MDYHELKLLLSLPAVKLVRTHKAPLVLGFIYRVFRENRRAALPEGQVRAALEAYLDDLRGAADAEDADEVYEDDVAGIQNKSRANAKVPTAPSVANHPKTAAEYLAVWCDDAHGFLRRYYDTGSDEPLYELTSGTEKAMLWLESLKQTRFVGTESRLENIFSTLDEILKFSDDDPTRRREQLIAEADALIAEADRIKATGHVESFTPVQINERFERILATARELLSDFRQVEDNFKRIAREIAERHAHPGVTKGAIVGHLLDSHDALRNSEQGQSFFAFWELLLSQEKRNRFEDQMRQVMVLDSLDADYRADATLPQFISLLVREGEIVVASHQRLSTNLRRVLDTSHLAERQQVGELLREIRQAALSVSQAPPAAPEFISIQDFPDVFSAMSRPLWQASASAQASGPIEEETGKLSVEELRRLQSLSKLSVSALKKNVETCLESAESVTLPQVLERFPPKEGVMEIVGYLIVASDENRHYISDDHEEIIEWQNTPHTPQAQPQRWRVPTILFSRKK